MISRSDGLKKIGFWSKVSRCDPVAEFVDEILNAIFTKLPDPRDHVDRSWDSYEREMVRKYLANGVVHQSYFGSAQCRMCHLVDGNGSRDFTDGVYLWPEGFAHYLEAHWVKPPQEFVEHVRRRVGHQQQQNQRK